jgi:hypothetical protein
MKTGNVLLSLLRLGAFARRLRDCAIVLLLASASLVAQDLAPEPKTPEAKTPVVKPPQLTAGELVQRAVANEVAAANDPAKHLFRVRKLTPNGSETRLYVETNDAMAGMLIATNDQPLTPEQQQAEDGHLQWLMDNPDQLRKKHAREKEDADRTLRIIKAFPDAFLYEYAGAAAGSDLAGKAGEPLVRVHFQPNPSYSPPSREEEVLTGMEGYALIDAKAERLAEINGTLFKDVSFGWGFFARLDKGGHLLIRQAEVEDHTWVITEMSLHFTGRILLVKSLHQSSDETSSDFRAVPSDLSFARGVEMLKAERARLARPAGPSQVAARPQ